MFQAAMSSSSSTAPKRPRGRPRGSKNKRRSDVGREALKEEAETVGDKLEDGGRDDAAMMTRKSRGRPKKENMKKMDRGDIGEASEGVSKKEESVVDGTAKRPRGRPKGSRSKNAKKMNKVENGETTGWVAPDNNIVATSKDSSANEPAPMKKPRGRPKNTSKKGDNMENGQAKEEATFHLDIVLTVKSPNGGWLRLEEDEEEQNGVEQAVKLPENDIAKRPRPKKDSKKMMGGASN